MSKPVESDEPEARFVAEGLSCYLDAMIALQTFRQYIQRECRDFLKQNLTAIASALHLPLKRQEVIIEEVPCVHESSPSWDTNYIWIQVKIDLKTTCKYLEYLSVGLEWNRDDTSVKILPYTCLGFMNMNAVSLLFDLYKNKHITQDRKGYYLIIYGQPKDPTDGFPRTELEWTIREWIRIWHKNKGVPKELPL